MVALVIGAIVAAAVGTVLRRQQRFFTSAARITEGRIALRDATGILPAELRALSPASGDLIAFSDSSLDMRVTIGAALVCDTVAGGAALDLAPARASRTNPLAAFSTTPQGGDVALAFDATAGAWTPLAIGSVVSSTSTCAASPLFDPVDDAGMLRLRLRFTAGVTAPAGVRHGAFVHVLRRVRYRLYRSGTDWYLGYSEWNGTELSVVQPVSGPFAPYSRRAGSSGLMLRYLDDADTPVTLATDAVRIARIEIVARTELGAGLSALQVVDSQHVAIRVRNQ